MKVPRPSHATVVAYLALFCAVGGSAYAVSKVGTADLKRSAVTSDKIKNKSVKGRDLGSNSVGRRQLRASVEPADLGLASMEFGDCNPTSPSPVECGTITVSLAKPGRVLAIVSGGQFSEGAPGSVRCDIHVDGARVSGRPDVPGEAATDNTSLTATNGFARAAVSEHLPAGTHHVSLACSELGGDARLAAPTIAALAVPGEE